MSDETLPRVSVQVLQEAIALQNKKSADYQNPNSTVVQADYYPNGITTLQDIIWAKTLRARSLIESGNTPNNESLEDTYIDLINYASFAVAWLRKGIPGQPIGRDIFNKRPDLDPNVVNAIAAAMAGTNAGQPNTTFWPQNTVNDPE